MSSLKQARERLQDEWTRLQDRWQAAAEQWRDAVQRRFEREFWQEYERTLPPVLHQMDRLAEVIAQARRELKK
jgi:uncharacterized protein YukE